MTITMTTQLSRQQRHRKQVQDNIAQAQQERGQILLITGNGKGKTTAGFGTVIRALGHQQQVAVVQFVKGNHECGERNLLTLLNIYVHTMETGFSWDSDNPDNDHIAALQAWQQAKHYLQDPNLDLVLLDELTYMITWGVIDVTEVIAALQQRPCTMSVIITGRAAHRELKAIADTVSEIRPVKHAFKQGLKARKGLDW